MGAVEFFVIGFFLASFLAFLIGWLYLQHLIRNNEILERDKKSAQEELKLCLEAKIELEDRHEMISEIFDASPSIIFIKNTLGQIVLVNDRITKVFGGKKEDYIGKTDFEFFPPLVAKSIRDDDEKVLKTGQAMMFEEIAPGLDGQNIILSSSKFPLVNRHGKPYAICGFSTDITEKRKTEENLEIALEALGMGAFEWDALNDKHYWSDGMSHLFDYRPDENFSYEAFFDLVDPADRDKTLLFTNEALKRGKEYSVEYRLKNSERWISTRARPYLNEEGKIIRLLGVCWDTSKAKADELALKQALEAREEFIRVVSHQIKTPLSSLKLRFQMVRRNIEKGEEAIYSPMNVNRLIEATELELSRLEKTAKGLVP